MKHINLIFLLLAVVASSALAQTVSSDTIATRLWRQVNAFPQEKLYTQTDRAEYTCGDTIWMRHHVVDALTGVPCQPIRLCGVSEPDGLNGKPSYDEAGREWDYIRIYAHYNRYAVRAVHAPCIYEIHGWHYTRLSVYTVRKAA